MPANVPTVVFVGGGPRTAGILERLAANRPELFDAPLDIHVIEPHTAGSGRIWRYDQHPGLMLNSAAADVTMFTDASVSCEGPVADGPGPGRLGRRRPGRLHRRRPRAPGGASAPAAGTLRRHFPTRQLQSAYLEWFFRRAVAQLAPDAAVTVHQDTAVGIEPDPATAGQHDDGGYLVRLAGGAALPADVVVSAVGHTDSLPARSPRRGPTLPPGTAGSMRRPATPPTSTIQRSALART